MFSANRAIGFRRLAYGSFAGLSLLLFLSVAPMMEAMDFRGFYCGGAALKQAANPYRVEPTRSCQQEVLSSQGLRLNSTFVVPAPLPPYALAVFSALALMPYRLAASLWLVTSAIAIAISIAAVSKLSNVHAATVATALIVPAGYVSVVLGQSVPIVLAAVLFTALSARGCNGIGCAIGASIAAIEPHLALPVWLGLIVYVPEARKPLMVAAAALSAMTLVPGVALTIEYVRSVLPEHARSELLNFRGQYGLSSFLAGFNVPFGNALRAGSACYGIMLAFGLAVSAALRRRYDDRAFYVTAPVASVVLGGPFLHITQTVLAIPLAFMLAARSPRYTPTFNALILAIGLLAIPWQLVGDRRGPQINAGTRAVLQKTGAMFRNAPASEALEVPYTAYVDSFGRRTSRRRLRQELEPKFMTWLALLAILVSAARLGFGPQTPHTIEALQNNHTRSRRPV